MDAADNVEDMETTVVEPDSPNDSGNVSDASNSSSASFKTTLGDSSSSNNTSMESLLDDIKLEDDEESKEVADIQLDHALDSKVELFIDRDEADDKKGILLNMDKTATVNDALNQASLLGDFASEDFDLWMGDRALPRIITLRDAAIPYGTRLRLVERPYQIFLRRVDGRNITMDVRSSDTIQSLKERFNYTDQVPIHQQRLLFQSKELENTRTLKSYGVRARASLDMAYRLRGGAKAI